MGEQAALVRTWQVGRRKVTMTVAQTRKGEVANAVIEWSPAMPHHLSRRELRQYRTGRDAAFADLCGALGIRGLLCEI